MGRDEDRKMRFVYPIGFMPDEYDDGRPAVLVTFPDLPDAIASGGTREEASKWPWAAA